MTWLQFIASLVYSVAWPVATIIVIALLRKPLTRLLVSLRHLSAKGIEFDFGQEVASLEVELDQAKIPEVSIPTESSATPSARQSSEEIDAEIKALALISPEAAVARAWLEVEQVLEQTMLRLGYGKARNSFARRDISLLHDSHYLDDETYRILVRLSLLRNKAVHPSAANETTGITYDDALDYARLAKRMAQRLNATELR